MSDSTDTPTRRMIFTADVEHYSSRSTWSQIDIQQDLVDTISASAAAVGLDHGRWLQQGQGDAELALLPPGTDEALVLADLSRELRRRLRRRNHAYAPDGRMRLRVALHTGITHVGANGFPGKAPVVACRLRDSDVLRAALAAVPDAELVVIIPADLYKDLVLNEYRGLRPSDFGKAHITNKEYDADAYIWVPDHPVTSWSAAVAGPERPAGSTPAPPRPGHGAPTGQSLSGIHTGHGNLTQTQAGRDINSPPGGGM